MKRTPLSRRTPLKRGGPLQRRTPLKPFGKKGRAWNRERAAQKKKFQAANITTCEVKLPGCWRDNGLGFAHLKKRRNLKPGELMKVVLCCNVCHDKLELLPESEMTKRLQAIIDCRNIGDYFSGDQLANAVVF